MWELMSCCLTCFVPRQIFQPYVAAFCIQAQRDKVSPPAAWCLQLLRHAVSVPHPRKRLPCDAEMKTAKNFRLYCFAGTHNDIISSVLFFFI